jgi:hypothetical protein
MLNKQYSNDLQVDTNVECKNRQNQIYGSKDMKV